MSAITIDIITLLHIYVFTCFFLCRRIEDVKNPIGSEMLAYLHADKRAYFSFLGQQPSRAGHNGC